MGDVGYRSMHQGIFHRFFFQSRSISPRASRFGTFHLGTTSWLLGHPRLYLIPRSKAAKADGNLVAASAAAQQGRLVFESNDGRSAFGEVMSGWHTPATFHFHVTCCLPCQKLGTLLARFFELSRPCFEATELETTMLATTFDPQTQQHRLP